MKEIKEKYENLVAEVITVETEKGYCTSVEGMKSVNVHRWGSATGGWGDDAKE